MRVPASGGKCETISSPDQQKGEIAHRWPQILPGGRSILFTIGTSGLFDSARIAVLDRMTGTYSVLVNGASAGRYVPSGHLVYVRRGILFAAPFDLKKLTITGPEAQVIDGMYFNPTGGYADYTFSNSGLLLYMRETRLTGLPTLDWANREGALQHTAAPPRPYLSGVYIKASNIRLSRDGRLAAVTIIGAEGDTDIWIADLVRGDLSRLTSGGYNIHPIWTPDGKRVVFYHRSPQGAPGIYWAQADGGRKPELLLSTPPFALPDSWTPDAKTLLYETSEPGSRIWAFTLSGNAEDAKPKELMEAAQFNESEAQISPDGRWIA
jgi:serine/threonine-protein kinase